MKIFNSIYVPLCIVCLSCGTWVQTSDVGCIGHFSHIFSEEIQDNLALCNALNKTLYCMDESVLHSLFMKSRSKIVFQLCHDDVIYDFLSHKSCIRDHGFRLIRCFANIWSMVPSSGSTFSQTLYCKRIRNFYDCPADVLHFPCKKEASNVMEKVINVFLSKVMDWSCDGFSYHDLMAIQTKKTFGNEYANIAQCLDEDQSAVGSCLRNVLPDGSFEDLKQHFCHSSEAVDQCLKRSLESSCSIPSQAPDLISGLFSTLGLFHCKKSQQSVLNRNYTQQPTTITEVKINEASTKMAIGSTNLAQLSKDLSTPSTTVEFPQIVNTFSLHDPIVMNDTKYLNYSKISQESGITENLQSDKAFTMSVTTMSILNSKNRAAVLLPSSGQKTMMEFFYVLISVFSTLYIS